MLDLKMLKMDTIQNKKKTQQLWDCVHDDHKLSNKFIHFYSVPFPSSIWLFPCHHLWQHIWACAKRCSVRTIHFLVVNASSGLSFLWTNLTLSERVCIKEIIKIKLDSQSQFWVSKIWKFTPSPGRKSAKEGWTFRVHRFSCRFVCIFLFQAIFLLLPDRT